MFDLLMLTVHKQSYVMLNKRQIAVFDTSTVILCNTLKTPTPLVEANDSQHYMSQTVCLVDQTSVLVLIQRKIRMTGPVLDRSLLHDCCAGRLKTRNWTSRDHIARVDIARP